MYRLFNVVGGLGWGQVVDWRIMMVIRWAAFVKEAGRISNILRCFFFFFDKAVVATKTKKLEFLVDFL